MCGIVGYVNLDPLVGTSRDMQNFARDALVADMLRGYDGTGVVYVDKEGDVSTYKRALCGLDFVCHKTAQKLITKGGKAQLFIGHNRSATSGKINNDTSHPFQHGHITLVHNGTLDYYTGIDNAPLEISVDSEEIAWALSKEEPEEVLPKIRGAYVLVWHDSRDNSVVFARNDERPLYFMHNKRDSMMFFGSCPETLKIALKDRITGKPTVDNLEDPYEAAVGKIIRLPLHTSAKEINNAWNIKKFKPYVKPLTTYSSTTLGGNFPVKKQSGQTTTGTNTTNSVTDTSQKKDKLGIEILNKLELAINTPILFRKESLVFTKTNKDCCMMKGYIVSTEGSCISQGTQVYANDVPNEIAKDKGPIFSGNILTAFNHSQKKVKIVVVRDVIAEGSVKEFEDGKFDTIDINNYPDYAPDFEDVLDLTSTDMVKLTEHHWMHKEHYERLIKHGCSWCSADLEHYKPSELGWYSVDSPLCPDCASSLDYKGDRDENTQQKAS